MEQQPLNSQPQQGDLNWRLSAHPITLLTFLGFRLGALLIILVFILTLLLLSADFYYLKNIAGRRLVGLRWWNEVNTTTGDSHWVFESADPNTRTIAATDKRFFWLSLYVAPALWIGLGILAIVRLNSVIWLSLIGTYTFSTQTQIRIRGGWKGADLFRVAIALVLTITNTTAFSRCDRFSQASTYANIIRVNVYWLFTPYGEDNHERLLNLPVVLSLTESPITFKPPVFCADEI
ncbi:hypothetical protein AN3576.2 [Aspergillus nidulans FGSC A4]|nr:hypothetical protein AN3576.2 [Aspergillus nidulans FGSC A4]|eukprot:XP_661180.1 hypothetical protein AN3576.2 [Aspergillus nidulans FGSC A4]